MKYCTKCGNSMEDGQQVCANCGRLADMVQTSHQGLQANDTSPQSIVSDVFGKIKSNPFWVAHKKPIIIGAIVLIIFAGGVVESYSGNSSTPAVRFKHYDDYDEVLEDVSKAVANKDAHLLCQTMFDKETYGKLTEEDFSHFEKGISFWYSFSGGDIEFTSSSSSSFLSSFLPLDEYELNDIMHTYEYYYGGHPKIIEGYYFDVNVEIAGESDLFAPIHFFEVEGEGWKMAAYDFTEALG